MATRFRYNTATCRYEPFYIKGSVLRNRIILFLSISFFLAVGSYLYVLKYIPSLDEILLGEENQRLQIEWEILHERIEEAHHKLAILIEKGDNNYRVILDSPPVGCQHSRSRYWR